jgi:SnoaL-like domain
VGVLFQPRWSGERRGLAGDQAGRDVGFDRGRVFVAALEAVVLGDVERFEVLFTDDVVFASPHLMVESLSVLRQAVGFPEDSLSHIVLIVIGLDEVGDKVIGEWRLDALFTQPVLYDDQLLIEPTGEPVRLCGASVAEFREHRICAFRHYFDDSELLSDVPGTPTHLRWSLDR